MPSKVFKIRNRTDVRIVGSKYTIRIQHLIENEWYTSARVFPDINDRGKSGYRFEKYKYPQLYQGSKLFLNTQDKLRFAVKKQYGITIPKKAIEELDSHVLMRRIQQC